MKETGSQPPRGPFFFPGVVGTAFLSFLTLASCSFSRSHPAHDAPAAAASVPAASAPPDALPPSGTPALLGERRVGVVRVIGDAQRFVLIEVPVSGAGPLPDGMLLRCSPPATDAPTNTMLRVSMERRRPFIVADVLNGEPHVGDTVFVERQGSPAPSMNPTQPPLLTEDEARARILAQIKPLPSAPAPLWEAHGRFAAREVFASQPLPAFDNSSMDGYAVLLPGNCSLAAGTRLQVRGEQAAGIDRRLRGVPGEAIRIFTGAPIPGDIGAVVMQEDVERDGEIIVLKEPVKPGENIRRAGGDLARGQRLFDAGARLSAPRLALLASQGLAEIEVARAPRVAVLATGDELRRAGETLNPGEIYESNGTLLATLAAPLGARVAVLGYARDERGDLDARLAAGLDGHDVLVIAGGVSVGERDLVKERLAAAGVQLDLWRVKVQPGKPFLYGRAHSAHVFGLPGNPVSAFVTFLLFVRPALLKLMGASEAELPLRSFPARAGVELVNRGNRPHYLRGTLDAHGTFEPAGRQESHALFALSRSDALACVAPGTTVPAGEETRVFVWD